MGICTKKKKIVNFLRWKNLRVLWNTWCKVASQDSEKKLKHSVRCLQNSVQFHKQSVTCLHISVQLPKQSVTRLYNSVQ